MIARHILYQLPKSLFNNKSAINGKRIVCQFATMPMDTPLDSKEKIQILRKQPWFQDYHIASKFSSQEKHLDALRHYYKVIQIMEEKNQKGQAFYYKIFEKVLKINVLLQRPLETQENLYRVIKVKKSLQRNPILVYEDYQNLMIHQLNHNVQKAIKLGKALLSQSQINSLPINNEKHIRMLLGNGYLLVDNYADAKKKYGEVLEMKPSHTLRGKTLNNLSIACWWHKNPLFLAQQSLGNYEELRINRDFKQSKQLLMNSIGALENIDALSQMEANALQSLLNQNPDAMLAVSSKGNNKESFSYSIQSKQSLQPIYNIIQYYIYNDPIQKPLILAWMRILLKAASRFQSPYIIDEITSKYYLLNNEISQLKSLLKTLVPKYEQSLSSQKSDDSTNQKMHLLQVYKMASLINRVVPFAPSELSIDQNKISSLEKEITQKDSFAFKRQFILGDELSFMKRQKTQKN